MDVKDMKTLLLGQVPYDGQMKLTDLAFLFLILKEYHLH